MLTLIHCWYASLVGVFFSIPTANKWWTSARLWCLLENSCQNTQTIILLHARTCKYTCKLQMQHTYHWKNCSLHQTIFSVQNINMHKHAHLNTRKKKRNAWQVLPFHRRQLCSDVHKCALFFRLFFNIRRYCLVHQDFIKMIMWNTREFDTVCAFRLVNK